MDNLNIKFIDEVATNKNQFIITYENGTTDTITLNRNAVVSQNGTPLSADVFNQIVTYCNSLNTNKVPNTRKINNKTLTTDIILNASDIGLGNVALTSDIEPIKNELVENEYNLGYYDTIIANDDGSYTITRQTGYLKLDGVKHKFNAKYETTYNGMYANYDIKNYALLPSSSAIVAYIISNSLKTYDANTIYSQNIYGISLSPNGSLSAGLTTAITTIDEANAYLATNNIYIQYKLASSTTEIVEKNHFARYNERFILEHNKQEAERSANLGYFADREGKYWGTPQDDINSIVNSLPSGTYTFSFDITALSIDSGYSLNDCFVWFQIAGGQYTDVNGIYKECLFSSLNDTKRFSLTFNKENYNNYIVRLWGIGNHNGGNHGLIRCSNIALNEGSTALPYQPYEGKVVHEGGLTSDLDPIKNNITALTNATQQALDLKADKSELSSVAFNVHNISFTATDLRLACNFSIISALGDEFILDLFVDYMLDKLDSDKSTFISCYGKMDERVIIGLTLSTNYDDELLFSFTFADGSTFEPNHDYSIFSAFKDDVYEL